MSLFFFYFKLIREIHRPYYEKEELAQLVEH